MKLLFTLAIGCLSISASASSEIARLQPDQVSYQVGEKAVVFAHIDRPPLNPTKEFSLEVRIDGEPVNVIPLSDRLSLVLPGRFQVAKELSLESTVFLQDRAEQLQLRQSRAFYQRRIDSLLQQIAQENDPEAKLILNARLANERQKYLQIQSQIESGRTLIEVAHSSISVAPESSLKRASILEVSADRDPATYGVGEKANFTIHLNSLFDGVDGDDEVILRGKIGADDLSPPVKIGEDFVFQTLAFTEPQIGSGSFEATLLIRSKAQSNLLRSGHEIARSKKRSYERQLEGSLTDEERAYIELKVAELSSAMSAINERLMEILLEVDQRSVEFTVTE